MKSAVKNALKNAKGGTVVQAALVVDYPMQAETIRSDEYTVRVSAPDTAEAVDVSVDQGPWLACRKAEGFWWYDWSGFENGEHEVIARTAGKDGRFLMSIPAEFLVERPA